jgi:hypothetical protein
MRPYRIATGELTREAAEEWIADAIERGLIDEDEAEISRYRDGYCVISFYVD